MERHRPVRAWRPRRLLLAIHDVAPHHEAEVDALYERLRPTADTPLAMFVVPDFWGRDPIVRGSPFARRLRRWADDGVEMFLHGFHHRDDAAHATLAARVKARHLTAGEGEFLGIHRSEAAHRIAAGRRLVEEVIGRPIAGFVAPAWLYGPGAHAALADQRVALAEDHWRVWRPADGRILARSPVVTWATRTPGRMLSSLAVAALARRLPLPRIVRIGVHPGDCGEPAVLRSISRTVAKVSRSHRPSSYASLLEDLPCAS